MRPAALISVITPAYNAEKVLADALESVRTQRYEQWEAIVVDDGSTDRTLEIVEGFAKRDSRFRLLQQPNAGSSVARNRALKLARGEFVAFLDADDMWFPGKLESQVALADADARANFFFTNYWIGNEKTDRGLRYPKPGAMPGGDVARKLYRGNLFGTSTVMLRRDTLDRAGGFDPELRHVHDWDLWLRIAEGGIQARGIWEPQARYRVWSRNVTTDRVRNATWAVRTMEKALARPHPPQTARQYRRGLAMARARLELARGQSLLESAPEAVPASVLCAWRCDPRDVKWLLRYIGLIWPAALGGRWTARVVRERLQRWKRGWRLEILKTEPPEAGSDKTKSTITAEPPASR